MIAMLQRLSRRHTSAVQQAKEGSPFLRGDPQYTGRMGTPGTPFYRENGDPGSPFSRDPQNFDRRLSSASRIGPEIAPK